MTKVATSKSRPKRLTVAQSERVLDGDFDRPSTSLFYLMGLFIVAVAMILLPLIYVGIVAGTAYAVYYHTTHNLTIVSSGTAGIYGRLMLYVAPIVTGIVLVLFMLKPLLARHRAQRLSVLLQPDQEPVLFAFVGSLCRKIGAPMPREIEVTCAVNASAGFRRGFRSIFSNDLTLTIGLPLVLGMTLPQFAGILAHEFGHFTQMIGMRLTFLIRSVNAWFARVVYDRDQWDEMLEAASRENDWLSIVFLVARLGVWLTRRVLWLLMIIGHGISCFVLRQMEYGADRYQARLVGTKQFVATMEKLHLLMLASMKAHSQLEATWTERRLVDNLPLLIAASVRQVPEELRQEIQQNLREGRTGLFDTHPSDRDRIRSVEKKPRPGIVRSGVPAALLMSKTDAGCRAASLLYYRDSLGPSVHTQNLVSAKVLLAEESREQADQKAIAKYFGHEIVVSRAVFFQTDAASRSQNPSECLHNLRRTYAKISKALSQITAAYKKHEEADQTLSQMAVASALCRFKIKFDAAEFGLENATEKHIAKKQQEASAHQRSTESVLQAYEQIQSDRTFNALRLLRAPAVAERVDGSAPKFQEAEVMLATLAKLRGALTSFPGMQRDHLTMCALGELAAADPENDTLLAIVRRSSDNLYEYLVDSRAELQHPEYPFRHAHGTVSIASYLLDHNPSAKDIGSVAIAFETFSQNLWALYFRSLGRLAHIALEVEQAVGLHARHRAERARESSAGKSP